MGKNQKAAILTSLLNVEKHPSSEISPIDHIAETCDNCGKCTVSCELLKRYGTPGEIAKQHTADEDNHFYTAYNCNLGGLCKAVCPKKLPIATMFLDLRKKAVSLRKGTYSQHNKLRLYEKIGSSSPFTYWHIPKNCTSVFFPGCALPGIRAEQTLLLYEFLQKVIPGLGFVLDCCHKPSHDLGDFSTFKEKFQTKIRRLNGLGVTSIVTGCPSCLQIFQQYGEGLEVTMAYNWIAEQKMEHPEMMKPSGGEFTIHDPCTTRTTPENQLAIRSIAHSLGITITEMKHSLNKTICCGEGGGACFVRTKNWHNVKEKRLAEAKNLPIITYCAGCTATLATEKTFHLVDLLFPQEKSTDGRGQKTVRAPWTYLNRLMLKWKLKRKAK